MERQYTFEAIGTTWVIDIFEKIDNEASENLLLSINKRIQEFSDIYSRFLPHSLITQISQKKGTYLFPPDAELLISTYKTLYEVTGGLFTPLIGNTLVDTGYDASYTLLPKKTVTAPSVWEDTIEFAAPYLHVKQPVLLDFGAGGKGYLVELVSECIEKIGIHRYCIDAGGDIKIMNTTPITIGLEDPGDFSKVIGVVEMINGSLCGSSGSRRKWGEYHHIINPKTLTSPTEIIAVWVSCNSTLLADAISTALFFTQAEQLSQHFVFEYLILRSDYSIEMSSKFNAELFT